MDYTVTVFIHVAIGGAQTAKSREILRKFELKAVHVHPRSLIIVSIESAYATSC